MPAKCPVCGGAVARRKGEVATYCLNKKCFAVEKEKIIHFVSKKGFDIEGLGEKIVEQLISEGLISSAAEIFALKKGDLEPMERFAEKSADNLINAINESKKIELSKFLYALGIRYAGEETAILIAKVVNTEITNYKLQITNKYQNPNIKIQNINNIISIFPKIKKEDWEGIKRIGEKSAENLARWFGDKENIKLLKKMEESGVKILINEQSAEENNKLNGKTFVLTGEMKSFTRDQAKDIIRKKGGNIAGSVSRKTDYVVVGENPGSKYEKAKELGVKIIGEEEFKKIIK
jgi:DNA ligase (NAD+)